MNHRFELLTPGEQLREHLPRTYKAISDLSASGAAARGRDAFADSGAGKVHEGKPTDRNDGARAAQAEPDSNKVAT